MSNFFENLNSYGPPEEELQASGGSDIYNNMDSILKSIDADERKALQETERQMSIMHEARLRYAKAGLYEQILGGRIFDGDDSVTLEVESEFKEFAEKRLCALLGIENETDKNAPKLDADQIKVLGALADRILKRDTPNVLVSGISNKSDTPKQVGQLATPKKGRPSKQAPKHTRPSLPPSISTAPKPTNSPPESDTVKVVLPGGKQVEVKRDKPQVRPSFATGSPAPKPMPSGDEMVALAAIQGEQAAMGSGLIKVVETIKAGTMATGE